MKVDEKVIQEFIYNVAKDDAHDIVHQAADMILMMDPETIKLFVATPETYLICLLGYFEYHEAYELCIGLKRMIEYYENNPVHHEKSSSNTIN